MVGFDPGAQAAAPCAEEAALAGSAAGLVTRALISPFDVLKIRFQVRPYLVFKTKSLQYLSQYLGLYTVVQDMLLNCVFRSCPSSRLNLCLQGRRRESTGDFSRRSAASDLRRVSLLFGRATSRHSCSPFATALFRFVLKKKKRGNLRLVQPKKVKWVVTVFSACSLSASSSWLKPCTTPRRTTVRRLEFTLCAGVWPHVPPRWSASHWTPWGHASPPRESPR